MARHEPYEPAANLLDRGSLSSQADREWTSAWRKLKQERITTFADATDDHQFIHVDRVRAASETPYGTTIAHGMLLLSLIPALSFECVPDVIGRTLSLNYGFDRVRFLTPVPRGRIRARFTLSDVQERGTNDLLCRYHIEFDIEGRETLAPRIGFNCCGSPRRASRAGLAQPTLSNKFGPIRTAKDLVRMPLIELNIVPGLWDRWFANADRRVKVGQLRLSSDSLLAAIQMAEAGVRVILAPFPLVTCLVATGRLGLLCHPLMLLDRPDFYLLCRKRDLGSPKIKALKF